MTSARRGEIALLLVQKQMRDQNYELIKELLTDSVAVAARMNIDPNEMAEFVAQCVVDIFNEPVCQLDVFKATSSATQLELFECPGYPAPKDMRGLTEFRD